MPCSCHALLMSCSCHVMPCSCHARASHGHDGDIMFLAHDPCETFHLYDADAAGRGLEPDSVQPGRLYAESLRVHANCRLRRLYFSDRLYAEEELPAEFKLFLPLQNGNAAANAAASAANAANAANSATGANAGNAGEEKKVESASA